MKTKTYLKAFFISLLPLQLIAQTLNPEQLHQDFQLFRTALHEAHPGMYRYTAKPVFDARFDSVKALLNRPMTRQEFYCLMNPLVVSLHCGHTKWLAAGREEKYPFYTSGLFPLHLYFIGDKAWIRGNYGNEAIPNGAEVVSINGRPVAAIIHQLLPSLTFGDGNTSNGKYEDLNRYFSGLYSTFHGVSETYEVRYWNGNQEETKILPSVTLDAIHAYETQHTIGHTQAARIKFLHDQIAVLSIDRFWVGEDEMKFKTFLKDTFRQLKEKHIQSLIIDLRNNEGGMDVYGKRLYAYLADKPFRYYTKLGVAQKKKFSFDAWTPRFYNLIRIAKVRKTTEGYVLKSRKRLNEWKPRKDAFQGDVYALMNGTSFSVTTEFASVLHHYKRATFIGQESGGGYYGDNSGVFAVVQLPNTKLELGIPLVAYYSAVSGYPYSDRGIIPDFPIVPTIEELLTGKDHAMEFTLDLIQRKGKVE